MKLKYHFIFTLSLFKIFATSATDWNILLYIDSSYGLSHVALKNIADCISGYGNNQYNKASIAIQIHSMPLENGIGSEAYRYRVEKNILRQEASTILTYDATHDLFNAAQWAFNTPADHHMIILSSHGYGILDPVWNIHEQLWELDLDTLLQPTKHPHHIRGLMTIPSPQTLMTINQLQTGLEKITTTITHKKIDIVGFDMCLMAMAESAYALSPYAKIMISSQDYECEYGWHYFETFKQLGSIGRSPLLVSNLIVQTYNQFYSQVPTECEKSYTLSAVDLQYMDLLKQNYSMLCSLLDAYLSANTMLHQHIHSERHKIPSFCSTPVYVDIYELYNFWQSWAEHTHDNLLMKIVSTGKKIVEKSLLYNCHGIERNYAHGLSLYFPLSHINNSYEKSSFAYDTGWIDVLKKIVL